MLLENRAVRIRVTDSKNRTTIGKIIRKTNRKLNRVHRRLNIFPLKVVSGFQIICFSRISHLGKNRRIERIIQFVNKTFRKSSFFLRKIKFWQNRDYISVFEIRIFFFLFFVLLLFFLFFVFFLFVRLPFCLFSFFSFPCLLFFLSLNLCNTLYVISLMHGNCIFRSFRWAGKWCTWRKLKKCSGNIKRKRKRCYLRRGIKLLKIRSIINNIVQFRCISDFFVSYIHIDCRKLNWGSKIITEGRKILL